MHSKSIPGLILILFLSLGSFGQRSYNQIFEFRNQQINLVEHVPVEQQNLFPEYQPGTIYARGGVTSTGNFNYNMLLNALVSVNRRGEELVVVTPADSVVFENGTVLVGFPEVGLTERLAKHPGVSLAQRHTLRVRAEILIPGAYGQPTRTSAVTRFSSVDMSNDRTGGGRFYVLDNPDRDPMEVNVRYESSFIFRNKEGDHQVANRRQLLSAFPEYRREIRDFLAEMNTDFSSPADMKKLADYLGSLK
jgi:hypothetical protein